MRTHPLSHFCSELCFLMVFHFYSFPFSSFSFPSLSVPFPYFPLFSFRFPCFPSFHFLFLSLISFPFLEDPWKGRQLRFPCSLLFPLLNAATCPPVCHHGKAEAEGRRCSTTSGYTTCLVRVFGRYKAAAEGKSLSALCAYRRESCVFGVTVKTVWSLCLDGKAALEPPDRTGGEFRPNTRSLSPH